MEPLLQFEFWACVPPVGHFFDSSIVLRLWIYSSAPKLTQTYWLRNGGRLVYTCSGSDRAAL
jgi:hypothetical protein